jgi:hypothetical protein
MPQQSVDTDLRFRIAEIKKISSYENSPKKLNIDPKKIKKSNIRFGLKIEIDEQNGFISIYLKFDNNILIDNVDYNIFGIESLYVFQIKNFQEKYIDQETKKLIIPDDVMISFLNIAIAGTRGMFAVLLKTPKYKKIVLPIFNPKMNSTDAKKRLRETKK